MPKEMENIRSKQGLPSQQYSVGSYFLEVVFIKSWWTILFFLLSYFAYDRASYYKNQEECKLREKLHFIEQEKKQALVLQEDLKLQIASQEDEAFIELVLMRKLGLVPEGQTKVHFVPVK